MNPSLLQPPASPSFDSARVAHLLAAARAQFLAHGYEHLSIDALSRTAGVSKETIYRRFPDKAALFRAAVGKLDDPFVRRLPPLDLSADPEQVLAQCVAAIHDATADAEVASFMWITVCMAREFPDLARELSADGLAWLEPIRDYLQRCAAKAGHAEPVSLELTALLGSLAVEGPRLLMGWPARVPALRPAAAAQTARLYLHGWLRAPGDVDLTESSTPPPVSAPTLDPHLRALLECAAAEFHARGYRGANLDEIIGAARVGRGTLYRHFRSKSGLFAGAMQFAADELAAQAAPLPCEGTLSERLRQAALNAADLLWRPEAVALYRTVIGEARRAPEVAREVYLRTRRPLAEPVAEWLSAAAKAGAARDEDPDHAAAQFLTLATAGNRHLTSDLPPTPLERDRVAEAAVRLFLGGYRQALPNPG